MKYSETRPIESCPCTAWLITQVDGTEILQLWDAKTTIEEVIKFGLIKKGSHVQRIDSGEFIIADTILLGCLDGRKVTTDLEVIPQGA